MCDRGNDGALGEGVRGGSALLAKWLVEGLGCASLARTHPSLAPPPNRRGR